MPVYPDLESTEEFELAEIEEESELTEESEEDAERAEGETFTSDYEESESTVSSGDASESVEDGDAFTDISFVGTVSSGDSLVVYINDPEMMELFQSDQETVSLLLDSSLRIESQNEAVISILLIIVVVGMLHYIYRFFRLFF